MTTTTYNIPPSIYNAYNICKRQAWLMHHQLNANQQNDFLEIGKLIDETSFKREKKKVYLADIHAEIDMITKKNGSLCIAEIKKSSKMIGFASHQLMYYLYLLNKKGVKATGIIKIPKEKINIDVALDEEGNKKIEDTLLELKNIIEKEIPPRFEKPIKFCRKCAHNEFCWA